jgi:hypothetical protein
MAPNKDFKIAFCFTIENSSVVVGIGCFVSGKDQKQDSQNYIAQPCGDIQIEHKLKVNIKLLKMSKHTSPPSYYGNAIGFIVGRYPILISAGLRTVLDPL